MKHNEEGSVGIPDIVLFLYEKNALPICRFDKRGSVVAV